jgi:uncharacterized protein YgbK (DUF1537 family)
VLKKLKALGVRHVHYKVCSTFDSSPKIGSIGQVIDVATRIFPAPFVPVLTAAPALGRFTVFGTHFVRYGIGSDGAIHRLDRHPSITKHPVTPMTEADLRVHLAKQTKKKIALFDILNVALPEKEARTALRQILANGPAVVLFDALYPEQLARIGALIDGYASVIKPLFSVGSSGIETALASVWSKKRFSQTPAREAKQILVGSGSCSPITGQQIAWALKNDFAEVALQVTAFTSTKGEKEIKRATAAAVKLLRAGQSVIVHTARGGADKHITATLKNSIARTLGAALGKVLKNTLTEIEVPRLCIAGGDTSSFAAGVLGIEALEMVAALTPGAPLCRVIAPGSPADGLEIVFKGGQVGAENYFGVVKRGRI